MMLAILFFALATIAVCGAVSLIFSGIRFTARFR